MNRYFTTNVLRMFQNRKIYICTLGMALTLYMSGIAFIRSDGDSANLQDAFSVVSSSGFIILFYLLCVIGGGLSYCEDCNSGFTRYAVVRGDAKKYIRGHLFSAALGGCASMLGGMALYELLMIFTLWPIKGSFYAMFSQNHAYFISTVPAGCGSRRIGDDGDGMYSQYICRDGNAHSYLLHGHLPVQ